MFEKINTNLHGRHQSQNTVTRDFLKKYLSYAKAQKQPELTNDCVEFAAVFYASLRSKAMNYD